MLNWPKIQTKLTSTLRGQKWPRGAREVRSHVAVRFIGAKGSLRKTTVFERLIGVKVLC